MYRFLKLYSFISPGYICRGWVAGLCGTHISYIFQRKPGCFTFKQIMQVDFSYPANVSSLWLVFGMYDLYGNIPVTKLNRCWVEHAYLQTMYLAYVKVQQCKKWCVYILKYSWQCPYLCHKLMSTITTIFENLPCSRHHLSILNMFTYI